MIIFYTVLYFALALYLVQDELNSIEEKASKGGGIIITLGYFIDWLVALILFPILLIIRKCYDKNVIECYDFFVGVFNILKFVLAFLPTVILKFLIYLREIFRRFL